LIYDIDIEVNRKIMSSAKKDFAARLTRFRDGAEKDGFCRAYNLNAAKMGRYENERESPSLEKIAEICEKTRLSANWLLLGIPPESLDLPNSARSLSHAMEAKNILVDIINERPGDYSLSEEAKAKTTPKTEASRPRSLRSRRAKKREQ